MPSRGNGSAYIPDGYHNKFAALTLVESTQMSYKELLNLYYPEFVELSLLAKAKSWIEPTKSKRDKEQEEHRRRIRGY